MCGICRMPFDGCPPDGKYPGDDSPVVWGVCTHSFHLQCINRWGCSHRACMRAAGKASWQGWDSCARAARLLCSNRPGSTFAALPNGVAGGARQMACVISTQTARLLSVSRFKKALDW